MPQNQELTPFLPVEQSTKKLLLLSGLFICCVMIANIVATKIVSFGFTSATVAILFYPFTYVIADTVSEVWGKKIAQRMIWTGLAANVVMVCLFTIAVKLPAASFYQGQDAFEGVLLGVPRIVLASLIAYSISQNLDIYMFLGLRRRTNGRHLWLRNNASAMVSQLIDTSIFSLIAFVGSVPTQEIWKIIGTEYVIKIAFCIVLTPLVYALVAWARNYPKEAFHHDHAA
ncbi:transporter [Paenibacillus selenitireducens]|uniref:Probable queuosine precursor transporter n=1 Tax=Paenibacillus selenitireducens TaxID=1324314 RepID=A0A1T2XL84_9BACL|nr:queuosine precursor transporter [Paenibacillus selenitireducens]OPA80486.1 transporter [Paenibacillus selenitireducens]